MNDPYPRPAGGPSTPAAGTPNAAAASYPWDEDPPPEEEFGPDGRRVRHDAFTARRKHDFLKALAKTGGLEDACRLTGVSSRTVYRHQQEDPAFLRNCTLALRIIETPLELTAWQRAVEGVEQEFACGGQVHVRKRYDANLLRLLLQASNPKKYGPRPGFKRKRILKFERKQMEREIHAEIAAKRAAEAPSIEAVTAKIIREVEAIKRHRQAGQLAAGWTKSPDGEWVPPGYAPIPGWTPPPAPGACGATDGAQDLAPDGETPRDSL
ncbi:MAG: hypothetical protein E6G94_08830 [Alphaproteobacteria bacterium]|nr:MAG: hypothetical protein E6G94_08830 [Alphaproteobacteria bacterium]